METELLQQVKLAQLIFGIQRYLGSGVKSFFANHCLSMVAIASMAR